RAPPCDGALRTFTGDHCGPSRRARAAILDGTGGRAFVRHRARARTCSAVHRSRHRPVGLRIGRCVCDSPRGHVMTTAATAARWCVLFVTAFLLLSVGGAGIVAAPVTLPALYAASATSKSRAFSVAAAVVACLTAAEAGFGVAYLGVGVGFADRYWWTM